MTLVTSVRFAILTQTLTGRLFCYEEHFPPKFEYQVSEAKETKHRHASKEDLQVHQAERPDSDPQNVTEQFSAQFCQLKKHSAMASDY